MYTYRATAYRQASNSESPLLISFVATAEEILQWAGIPRRAEEGLIGFQRTADPVRVQKAAEFFRQAENQSPTALILGLHPSSGGVHYEVEFEAARTDDLSLEASFRHCLLTVHSRETELSPTEARDLVRAQLLARLPTEFDEPGSGEPIRELQSTVDDADYDAEYSPEELSEDDDAEEIELGTSVISDLLLRLEDEAWVARNIDDLRDMAKPATVIDGQHRILGAVEVDRDIPFTVVAIVDCPWAEQVFQFTVVNYTATGIPDQFITANAALSLTSSELDYLQDRLSQAGVKVTEYELMRVVNFDASSPFYGLVNLTEKPRPDRIGYKTMVRIAKAWYSARDPVFAQIHANLYPEIVGTPGPVKRERMTEWKTATWGEFFIAFWEVVRNRYDSKPSHEPGHNLWEVGHSQLMVAVVLQQLQAAFLSNLRAQDEEFFEVAGETNEEALQHLLGKIRTRAEKFLDSVPAGFFGIKWKTTSLNIGAGKIALDSALAQLIDKKGRYQYENSTLVKGKTD